MKKVISNYLYQVAYQLLAIMLPIITIPIVSRALGVYGIGLYNFVSSVVSYFVLVAGLGLANYGVREISIVRENRKKLSEKFWELQLFNFIFSFIALAIYIIVAFISKNSVFYYIQLTVVLAAIFDITWFFSGIEDFKKITVRNFCIKIITFCLIVLLIRDEADLIKYFIIQGIGTLVGSLSLWINLKKYIDVEKVTFKNIFHHFFPALSYFIAKIAISLYQNLTKTILGIIVGIGAVGLYSNAISLITMSGAIINAMNTIMIPRMSNIANKKGQEGIIPILEKTIHLQIYFTVGMSFGIMGISKTLIPWFFGENFSELQIILPLISPVLIVQSLQMSIATQYLIPMGFIKEYNISVIYGAVVSVIGTYILSNFIGVYGAVFSITLGYVVICVLRGKSLMDKSTFKFNWKVIFNFLISGITMTIILYILGNMLDNNIISTLIQVIIGIFVYIVISTLLGSNPLLKLFKEMKKEN